MQEFNNFSGETQENFNEIVKYIRFVDENIILGMINNSSSLKISNGRISFMAGEAEVAYISNGKLYITDDEFLNSLQLGNFAFEPRSNGNLSFYKNKKQLMGSTKSPKDFLGRGKTSKRSIFCSHKIHSEGSFDDGDIKHIRNGQFTR